jgi:cyclopropane fatty-acyl-phospholipid synthase-like methyltransferase
MRPLYCNIFHPIFKGINMTTEKPTINRHGYTFPLSKYTNAFIDYARTNQGTLLDIGAAFGVTTIPALLAGAKVIANDLSEEQLAILKQDTPEQVRTNLTLLTGRLPEFDLPANSLDGILASHVIHFLDPETLRIAIAKCHLWLKPGAKIFVQCFTPYHKFMEKFIPEYHRKIANKDPFPSYTEHSGDYVLVQDLVPQKVHLMDPTVLAREFIAAGFQIESVEFFPCPPNINADYWPLDGREWVGLIAYK